MTGHQPATQAQQLGALFDLLGLDPALHARLDAALQSHTLEAEARPPAATDWPARLVEALDPLEREAILRRRYHDDADGFIRALRAGSR